jgi:hypothetical protein
MVAPSRYFLEQPPLMVPVMLSLLQAFIPSILTALAVMREKELGSITNFYVTPVTRIEFLVVSRGVFTKAGVSGAPGSARGTGALRAGAGGVERAAAVQTETVTMKRLENILRLGLKDLRSLWRDKVLLFLILWVFTGGVYVAASVAAADINKAPIAIVDEMVVRYRFNPNLEGHWFGGVMEIINDMNLLAITLTSL